MQMHKFSNIATEILAQITSMLEGFQVFKLFAAGDSMMNCRLKNGGVTVIRLKSIFKPMSHYYNTVQIIDYVYPSQYRLEPFWLEFKHLNGIKIGENIAVPMRESSGEKKIPMLNIPISMISTLRSLSLAVYAPHLRDTWYRLTEADNAFACLESLSFGGYGNFPDAKLLNGDDTVKLPESIMSTLKHLKIKVTALYSLSSFPQNLTSLDICGTITDFNQVATIAGTTSGTSSSSCITSTVSSFPPSLSSLVFHLVDINKCNKFQYDLFYASLLLSDLKRLDVRGKFASKFETHQLPRKLQYLNVANAMLDSGNAISIADLPQTLTIWKASNQPLVLETTPVSLPPSLKLISFATRFNLELWPTVVLYRKSTTGCKLLIEKIEMSDFNYHSRLAMRHVVGSMTYTGGGEIELAQFTNCVDIIWTMSYMCSYRQLYRAVEFLPSSLTSLILCELCVSSPAGWEIFNPDRFFGSMPKTLTDLGLNLNCKAIHGNSDLCCDTHLAKLLPNLQKLNINLFTDITDYKPVPYSIRSGSSLEARRIRHAIIVPITMFSPFSLPSKLEYISISGMDVMIGSFFALLPSSTEECFVSGQIEDELFETVMPAHVGSTSSEGISMHIQMAISGRSEEEQATSLKEMAAFMRASNNYLNVVDIRWKSSKSHLGVAKNAYRKRVERE